MIFHKFLRAIIVPMADFGYATYQRFINTHVANINSFKLLKFHQLWLFFDT